jgi:hypothetical protein
MKSFFSRRQVKPVMTWRGLFRPALEFASRNRFRAAPVLLGLALLMLSGCRTEVELPQGYALIYGVADYSAAGLGSLNYTDDDARAMADLFSAKGWDVKLRIDNGTAGSVPGSTTIPDNEVGPATLAQLEADIAVLAGQAAPGSRFLINISSHGLQAASEVGLEPDGGDGDQEWFFLYSDIPLTIPYSGTHASWEGQVLQDDYLGVLLSRLPEGMKMVVVDACHSGGLIGDSPTVDPYPQIYQGQEGTISLAEALNRYYNYDPRADILADEALVLAAAGERESSVELGGINHGIFTYQFLQSPAKADDNGDGWITFGEAADYSISTTVGFQESLIQAYQEDPVNNPPYFTPYLYLPRLSGSGVDFVLFRAD